MWDVKGLLVTLWLWHDMNVEAPGASSSEQSRAVCNQVASASCSTDIHRPRLFQAFQSLQVFQIFRRVSHIFRCSFPTFSPRNWKVVSTSAVLWCSSRSASRCYGAEDMVPDLRHFGVFSQLEHVVVFTGWTKEGYDIWYMIYDLWYMIYDLWYMIYDMIWYQINICQSI